MIKVTEFLNGLKANAEKVAQLETEKTALEGDFKVQADLLASVQADSANHSKALVDAQSSIKEKDETIVSLQTQISEFEKLITEAHESKTTAAEEAVKIAATVGIAPLPITKNGSEEANKSVNADEIVNQFNSIKDLDEKQKFYNEHRSTILGFENKK
jgi:chromosome segregation ATPase